LIPVSLDHDGLLAMPALKPLYKGGENIFEELSQFDHLSNDEKALKCSHFICQRLNESSFKDWTVYLLDEPVPLEPKRFIFNGQNFDF
jgi:hypothetical protein